MIDSVPHTEPTRIEGAEMLVFDGMGHDLAKGLWPEVIEAITRHAGSVRA